MVIDKYILTVIDKADKITCITGDLKHPRAKYQMTEKPVLERKISIESESLRIPFLLDEIDSRFLAVDIEVVSRSDSVGSANFERYVPRIWSGYWYLLNNQSIKSYGAIEFKRQRIYEKEFPNLAYGMNNAFFDAGVIFGLELELDDLKAWYSAADFLANEDNESNGLYLAHPVSELIIYVPVGVDLEVKISRQSYPEVIDIEPSSNPVTGLDGEAITPSPTKPLESINSDILDGIERPPTLDDYVRDKGYILASECPSSPNNQTPSELLNAANIPFSTILSRLLLDGAIVDDDIFAIRASNPSATDEQIFNELLSQNKITNQEFNVAYERQITQKYGDTSGKKRVWVYTTGFTPQNTCLPTYNLYGISGVSGGGAQFFLVSNASEQPKMSDINWDAVPDTPPDIFTDIVFVENGQPFPICGLQHQFWNITINGNYINTVLSLYRPIPLFVVQP